jgi:hypothetical protein
MFKKATKEQSKLRLGIAGPSGAGKTYTALAIGTELGKAAVIDSEHGSASKYADRFNFDVLELEDFDPGNYVKAIHEAENEGYEVIIVDSLTHAWAGKGGALEMQHNVAKKSQSGNTYFAWREVTPRHDALVEAMLTSKCHVIATMRSKQDYIIEGNKPKKVGMAPVQRDGMEYEFDVFADLTLDHDLIVSKSRIETLDGKIINKPGKEFAGDLKAWLASGAVPVPRKPKESESSSPAPDSDKPKEAEQAKPAPSPKVIVPIEGAKDEALLSAVDRMKLAKVTTPEMIDLAVQTYGVSREKFAQELKKYQMAELLKAFE